MMFRHTKNGRCHLGLGFFCQGHCCCLRSPAQLHAHGGPSGGGEKGKGAYFPKLFPRKRGIMKC